MGRQYLPVRRSWRLNERHYGALQGLEQERDCRPAWRRSSVDMASQLRRPASTARFRGRASPPSRPALQRPGSGSPTRHRMPERRRRANASVLARHHRARSPRRAEPLVVAHGNSIRSGQHLDGIGDEEIVDLNIPTGVPLLYELDNSFSPLSSRYLGDPEAAEAGAEVAARRVGEARSR